MLLELLAADALFYAMHLGGKVLIGDVPGSHWPELIITVRPVVDVGLDDPVAHLLVHDRADRPIDWELLLVDT